VEMLKIMIRMMKIIIWEFFNSKEHFLGRCSYIRGLGKLVKSSKQRQPARAGWKPDLPILSPSMVRQAHHERHKSIFKAMLAVLRAERTVRIVEHSDNGAIIEPTKERGGQFWNLRR